MQRFDTGTLEERFWPSVAVRDELRFGEAFSARKHEKEHEERTLSRSPPEGTLKPIFA
jgi:hypothetical protein